MAEVKDDDQEFNIELITGVGEIIDIGFPETARDNEDVVGTCTIKNNSNVTEKYRVKLYDRETKTLLDTEPDLYKSVASGASYTIEGILGFGKPNMPNKNWLLRMDLYRKT